MVVKEEGVGVGGRGRGKGVDEMVGYPQLPSRRYQTRVSQGLAKRGFS